MSDTTAKIRAKGLEHTGITEKHADQMYDSIGSHYKGIVDLKVVRHSVDDDGKRTVELAIEGIELAPTDDVAEHLRRLTRSINYERGLAVNGGSQLPIPGADEPTVEQVRAAGRNHEADPEADERDLEAKEAAQDATDDQTDAHQADDPWEYDQPDGPTPIKVASPFDPQPTPAA